MFHSNFLISVGVHVSFTNWDPNRKDNDGPHWKEDCGILKPNGLWDDSVCKGFLFSEHHHPWICQYRKFSKYTISTLNIWKLTVFVHSRIFGGWHIGILSSFGRFQKINI